MCRQDTEIFTLCQIDGADRAAIHVPVPNDSRPLSRPLHVTLARRVEFLLWLARSSAPCVPLFDSPEDSTILSSPQFLAVNASNSLDRLFITTLAAFLPACYRMSMAPMRDKKKIII